MMRLTLQAVAGPHSGKRFVLSRGQSATFGRTPEADYQFPRDPLMSSRHFAIAVDAQGCRVRDLESRNGTFVDEKRIVERTLTDGSTILAGDTKFSVTLTEAAPLAPLPPLPPAQGLPPPSALPGSSPAALSPLGRAAQPPAAVSATAPAAEQADFFPPANVAFPPAGAAQLRQEIAAAAPLSATKVAPPRERWRSQASREFELALDDTDPIVRRNALLAAVWQRRRWVLDYCRAIAARPAPENWDALYMLCVLGRADDLPRVLAMTRAAELGPRRIALLAAYGHPQVIGDLVAALEGQDAELAMAAAEAFEKVTGTAVRAGGESAEAAPDSAAAGRAWRLLKAQHPDAVRLCRGHDLSRGATAETLAKLDLESRFEACLRGRLANRWESGPLDAEQLAAALHAEQPA